MTDSELIQLFANELEAIVEQQDYNLPVAQLNQPHQQALTSEGAIYFTFLFDHKHGWQTHKTTFNSSRDSFDETSTQHVESRVQISVLQEEEPGVIKRTAKDIAHDLSMRMATPAAVKRFRLKNVGILRITDVQNPAFVDDKERYERFPSFDVVFTHNRTVTDDVPKVSDIVGDIKRV